jgi:hypothetical protein
MPAPGVGRATPGGRRRADRLGHPPERYASSAAPRAIASRGMPKTEHFRLPHPHSVTVTTLTLAGVVSAEM